LFPRREREQHIPFFGCPRRMELPGRPDHGRRRSEQNMNLGELFSTNPKSLELLNNGVAFVKDVVTPEELKTLRFELKTFVCEGEYARGLEKILRTYLGNLDRPE